MATTPHVIEGSAELFPPLVLENSERGPVLVYYWSPRAGPCMMLMPRLLKLAGEIGGRFLLVLLNTDEFGQLSRSQGVVSIHGHLDTKAPHDGKIKHNILILHGDADPLVPPAQVAAFQEEMRKAGCDWRFVSYGGVVHAFTNPEAGKDKSTGLAHDEHAERRSWRAMRDFFDEIFT